MGLEVADAPYAGPDDIPSPGHTAGEPNPVLAGTISMVRM